MEDENNQIRRGDIYFADLNPVKGSEQDGVRPVVILQNDAGNRCSPTTIVAAITSNTQKNELPTHVLIQGYGLPKSSVILLEQIRTIDKCRLMKHITHLDGKTMSEIHDAIQISLGLKELEVLK